VKALVLRGGKINAVVFKVEKICVCDYCLCLFLKQFKHGVASFQIKLCKQIVQKEGGGRAGVFLNEQVFGQLDDYECNFVFSLGPKGSQFFCR